MLHKIVNKKFGLTIEYRQVKISPDFPARP
jgi:hypothetical protein